MQSVALKIGTRLVRGVSVVILLAVVVLLGGAGGRQTPAAAAQAVPATDRSLEPPHFRETPPAFVEGEIIVIFDDGATVGARPNGTAQVNGGPHAAAIESLFARFGVARAEPLVDATTRGREPLPAELLNMARLTLGEGQSVTEAVAAFGAAAGVAYAGPNRILTLDEADAPSLTPNDPDYANGYQYGLNGTYGIKAPEAWDRTTGSTDVRIAVLDSGIERSHFDLSAKYAGGYDYIYDDSDPEDDNGHGTHVSGIAAAMTNNSRGVAGVSWGSPVMAYKVCDSAGWCYSWPILQAITEAVGQPNVRVINLSLGGQYACPTDWQAAFDYAYSRGVTVVASAGNNSTFEPHTPASCDHVIAVGATDRYGKLAYFSNYGSWVDLVAPGQAIKSTYYGNTYGYMSGTSMSAPMVSGVVALIYSVLADDFLPQGQTVDRVRNLLITTTRDLGQSGPDFQFANGLVQAYGAVREASYARFEPDNTPATAWVLPDNQTQKRSIYPSGDQDWMSFTVSGTTAVTIEAAGGSGRITMGLYDTDLQQLEYDSGGTDNATSIVRECNDDALPPGHYYIHITGYNSNSTIYDYQTLLRRTEICDSPPTISSFTPAAGPPGTTVTINGTNLAAVTDVWFNGLQASFTLVSDTQVRATVPVGATTGRISLSNAAGTTNSATNFTVTVPGDWSPLNIGAAAGFTTETDGRVSVSATGGDIWDTADGGHFAHQTGSGDRVMVAQLTDWNAGGLVSGKAGLMMRASADAAAPSYAIHVTGPNRAIKVKYRTSTGWSTINLNGPNTADLPLWLRLTKSGDTVAAAYSTTGSSWTSIGDPQAIDGFGGSYLYGMIAASTSETTPVTATFVPSTFALPTISSLSPSSGPVGATVTINGANLAGATAVGFNGAAATFSQISATRLRATVPGGATTGKITVMTPGGTATSPTDFTIAAPGSWVPADIGNISGSTAVNGNQVTLRATGGDIWDAADNIHYAYQTTSGDRTFIARITAWDSAGIQAAKAGLMIRASADAAAPEYTIHITGPGRGVKAKVRTETGWATANVPGVNATTLPLWLRLTKSGDTVSSAFSTDGTTWTAVGTPQRISGIGDGYLFGMVAASKSETTEARATFEIADIRTPTITGFSPSSGPVGATVTVNGTNLSGLTAVRFNGTAGSFVPVSESQVMVVVPPGATTGRLSLTTAGGTATSATNFTVTAAAPTISSFSPSSGPVGTVVEINGAALLGTTNVRLNGVDTSFVQLSDNQLKIAVPDGATTGKITVTTSGGSVTSAASFTVTAAAPQVRGFYPAFGPVGAYVTIDGTNLSGVTAVTFNQTAALFMPISNIQLMAVVPPGATTGKISITTAAGSATSTTDFSVTAPPVYRVLLPFIRR